MQLPRFAVWLLGLALWGPSPATAQDQKQQDREPRSWTFSYARIYADSTGGSHFSDGVMELGLVEPGRGIPPTPASSPIPTTALRLFCPPPNGEANWHPPPSRVLNLIVSGEFQIDVSDGETRTFGPGGVILVEDTRGRGHRTRVVGSERACFAMIGLADR